jgi:hypothetical protein
MSQRAGGVAPFVPGGDEDVKKMKKMHSGC